MLQLLLFGAGRVLAYTVHERPDPATDRLDRAEALRFIKDGFSFPAAVAAPVWLAAHRLWLALGLYLAGVALIAAAHTWLGLPALAAIALAVAMHLLVGFEADTIERADLEHKGWSSLGAVTGASALECQRRFFDQWLPAQPILAPKAGMTSAPPRAPTPSQTNAVSQPGAAQVTSGRGAQTAAGRLAALWKGKP